MPDVAPIPDNYPRVSPYLVVDDAAAALAFYTQVFDGATERGRMPDGDRIGHAEIELGDSVIMLSDEYPDLGVTSPKTVGGTSVTISVYVEDVDATYERAIAAGAHVLRPVADQFYGDRAGWFQDPFGHRWTVASHVEDVPPEEMAARVAEADRSG